MILIDTSDVLTLPLCSGHCKDSCSWPDHQGTTTDWARSQIRRPLAIGVLMKVQTWRCFDGYAYRLTLPLTFHFPSQLTTLKTSLHLSQQAYYLKLIRSNNAFWPRSEIKAFIVNGKEFATTSIWPDTKRATWIRWQRILQHSVYNAGGLITILSA